MAGINPWNYNDPSKGAQGYLNGIPDTLKQYANPYVNAGNQAVGQLPGIYNQMLNPNQLLNQIGAGYHESPGFQFQLKQGLGGVNNAASAGGTLGSPQHEQQSAQMAEGLANQDYYAYLGKALGEFNQGAEGEAGLAGQGYNASHELGEDLSQNAMNEANLSYAGGANQNQHQGGTTGALLAMLGQIFGGGAGGSFGGMVGNGIEHLFGGG